MSLLKKQQAFTALIPSLISKAIELGYGVTLGECWRPEKVAKFYASESKDKGIAKSVHISRLAIDLNLYRDGRWLTAAKDYEPLGVFWESLSTDEYTCKWGGRFHSLDGVHFSFANEGVA